MSERNFMELLKAKWAQDKFVCVGLDSELKEIPESARRVSGYGGTVISNTLKAFNMAIIKATRGVVCAYKLNIAFYEGDEGYDALHSTIMIIKALAPDVPIILDSKRGDVAKTNAMYAHSDFDLLGADAVTVHPYLGAKVLEPFLERKDKGVFVLCRTSNEDAGEFQDLPVYDGEPLYRYVGRRVASHWNKNGNCGLVVGATYPEELREIRKFTGNIPILSPGIGAQDGDAEKTFSAGKDERGQGVILSSSSGIIFASKGEDFAEAARRETERLHNLTNRYLSPRETA